MRLHTTEGNITIGNDPHYYIGVYEPRDGRDHLLYELPHTGISILGVILAVRNKVNCTDLNGPSAQPRWLSGNGTIQFSLKFEKP